MTSKYAQLAQRMTREEMIVFQLRRQAQEAIDQAYYDAWLKFKELYPTPAEVMKP